MQKCSNKCGMVMLAGRPKSKSFGKPLKSLAVDPLKSHSTVLRAQNFDWSKLKKAWPGTPLPTESTAGERPLRTWRIEDETGPRRQEPVGRTRRGSLPTAISSSEHFPGKQKPTNTLTCPLYPPPLLRSLRY